jgi:hypothetical protein
MAEGKLEPKYGWGVKGGIIKLSNGDTVDFADENLRVSLHTKSWAPGSKWIDSETGSDGMTVSDEIDGGGYTSGGVTWTDSKVTFDPSFVRTIYTTSTSLDPDVIEVLTGGMKMPEPIEEVDLAVVCFRVRYFDSDTAYTYAATGVQVSPAAQRRWYVTGSDAPQGVSYDELLSWFTSNGREIVEMWVATSWKKLITETEEDA